MYSGFNRHVTPYLCPGECAEHATPGLQHPSTPALISGPLSSCTVGILADMMVSDLCAAGVPLVPLILAGDVRWRAIRMLWRDPAKIAERQNYNDVVHMMQKVSRRWKEGAVGSPRKEGAVCHSLHVQTLLLCGTGHGCVPRRQQECGGPCGEEHRRSMVIG